MKITPLSQQCERVLTKQEHALIGISPFNSYFSEQRINYIYRWAKKNFAHVHLYVPDEPTFFTLKALGYDDSKAKKKARRQCNYLRNKIFRALSTEGLSEAEARKLLIEHQVLNDNLNYQKCLSECHQRFEQDGEFRQGCLESSKWVLSNQLEDGVEPSEEMQLIAVNYFLAELPLFLWGSDILKMDSTVFCYQQCPEFLRKLFSDRSIEMLDERHGFAVIQPQSEDYSKQRVMQ